MRIVQTFWTAGRDPLKYSFGWTHPEYNLMSWALSCLSLREHYDEVALYTDQEGYDVLINKLHLPYTEVNVVYDKNLCLPHHWAYAKIKTYSMQTKPFIHVDGDVYLPHPIPEDIANAPLVAQNKEICTSYYRQMLKSISCTPQILFPIFIRKKMDECALSSYNMGVFGGQNLNFIKLYCQEVFQFMDENGMNDRKWAHSSLGCNVLIEQIFFGLIVENKNQNVTPLINRCIEDCGYKKSEFCDLLHFSKHNIHHILGGHKRRLETCQDLKDTLVSRYPNKYKCLASVLIPSNKSDIIKGTYGVSVERCIAQYEDFIQQIKRKWINLSTEEICLWDKKVANGFYSFFVTEEKKHSQVISNPNIEIYHIPVVWNKKATEMLNTRMGISKHHPTTSVAIIPSANTMGILEIPQSDFGEVMLKIILENKTLSCSEYETLLMNYLDYKSLTERDMIYKFVYQEIRKLSRYGLVAIS